MKYLMILITISLLQACATVSSVSRPDSYYQQPNQGLEIVGNDSHTKNGDQISILLNHRVKLPAKSRIAIVNLNQTGFLGYQDSGLNHLSQTLAEEFIGKLRSSTKIYDASFLPAMLIAPNRNLDSLRYSAARFQADLLLAYQSACSSFSDYNLVSQDRGRSYCSVEAILLDVRSGIVTLSSVSSETFNTRENSEDMSFYETMKKLEMSATNKALEKVARSVLDYLSRPKS